MSGCQLLVALYFRRYSRGNLSQRGDQEVDVVGALGRVQAIFLLHFHQLRNF
jgi:hypothetical protein